jgi:adenosylhomocysteine nucleosidase
MSTPDTPEVTVRRILNEAILTRFAVIAVSVAMLTLGSCQPAETPPVTEETFEVQDQRPLVILYAFPKEGAQLREWAQIRTDTSFAGRRVAVGWLGMPVVIAASGIGMTNAAAVTQHVIDKYDPLGIIFTGIAGAIATDYHIGDIAIPDRWITHDYGYYGAEGLLADSVAVGNPDSIGFTRMFEIPVDTGLYRQVVVAANSISFRFKKVGRRLPEVHDGGIGVTGNAFIDSKDKCENLRAFFDATIVDMESAAVVQTAHASGVPVVVIRSCSDKAGGAGSETASEQLNEFFEVAAYNSALVVKQFLETEW